MCGLCGVYEVCVCYLCVVYFWLITGLCFVCGVLMGAAYVSRICVSSMCRVSYGCGVCGDCVVYVFVLCEMRVGNLCLL